MDHDQARRSLTVALERLRDRGLDAISEQLLLEVAHALAQPIRGVPEDVVTRALRLRPLGYCATPFVGVNGWHLCDRHAADCTGLHEQITGHTDVAGVQVANGPDGKPIVWGEK